MTLLLKSRTYPKYDVSSTFKDASDETYNCGYVCLQNFDCCQLWYLLRVPFLRFLKWYRLKGINCNLVIRYTLMEQQCRCEQQHVNCADVNNNKRSVSIWITENRKSHNLVRSSSIYCKARRNTTDFHRMDLTKFLMYHHQTEYAWARFEPATLLLMN